MSAGLDAATLARTLAPTMSWSQSGYGFAAEGPSTDLLARLPLQYVEFLKALGAGEGFLGVNFLRLYPLDELAAANREYHVSEFLPGCQLFGSDACGNAYVFDLEKHPAEIIRAPFIPLDRAFASSMGSDFLAFVQSLAAVPQGYRGAVPSRPNPKTAGKEIHELKPVVLAAIRQTRPIKFSSRPVSTRKLRRSSTDSFGRLGSSKERNGC
jgi:hypothetical protein